jgi:hypothetical protein
MADDRFDGSVAPRRSLGGPILPPPPPEIADEARRAEEEKAASQQAAAEKKASAERASSERQAARDARSSEKAAAKRERSAAASRRAEQKRTVATPAESPAQQSAEAARPGRKSGPRRTRRAQLRLVQVDAWSVMKTSFLLSIALGIVLVVAVAIILSVLGAAGVWESINSIVQQAVGSDSGKQFDIQEYLGTSRVLGFTMIVAVLDVILITAIATLGAFLYNLSAALLGGIEVTLAEDN